MNKKRRAITSITIILILLVIGILASTLAFDVPGTYYRYKGFAFGLNKGREFDGGVIAIYERETPISSSDFDKFSDILSKEANVVRQSDNKLIVDVANAKDPNTVLTYVGEDAFFEIQASSSYQEGATLLDARDVRSAEYYLYNNTYHVLRIRFNDQGRQKLEEATSGDNSALYFFFGKTAFSGVNIAGADPISTGELYIQGNITSKSMATQYANRIMAGKYSQGYTLVSSRSYEATYGQNAFMFLQIAFLILLVAVIVALIVKFRYLGAVMGVSMLFVTVFILGFLSLVEYVEFNLGTIMGLTMGFVLTLITNLILVLNIVNEYKGGKKLPASMRFGFRKSYAIILDICILTLIAVFPMAFFGGSLPSFSITLMVMCALSVLSSLGITYGMGKMLLDIKSTNPKIFGLKKGDVNEK